MDRLKKNYNNYFIYFDSDGSVVKVLHYTLYMDLVRFGHQTITGIAQSIS